MIRACVILGCVVLFGGLVLVEYKEFTLFGRQNRDLRMYINPTYPINSLIKVLSDSYSSKTKQPIEIIAGDAERVDSAPKQVMVLVVGETARAQEFSLNELWPQHQFSAE